MYIKVLMESSEAPICDFGKVEQTGISLKKLNSAFTTPKFVVRLAKDAIEILKNQKLN